MARVVAISVAPVKGLALERRESVELTLAGVEGDRRFYLVDESGHLINQKRVPALATVFPAVTDGRVCLRFPGGEEVAAEVELGEEVETSFYGRPVRGRLVVGPWSEALTGHAGTTLRLVRTEREGDGLDRGTRAGVSMISTGSLRALAAQAGRDAVDGRRFRMLLTLDGLEPHGEDAWLDRRVRVGGATIELVGNVGRCAVTTRDPDTGVRDLETLDLIEAYRGDVPTTEPLPFGVWGRIVEPGAVRLGDPAEPEP
ncbi:MAG TPA: MOSC N-terminal beta barrel domain-containing protein [Gaiellaceae bacterium]